MVSWQTFARQRTDLAAIGERMLRVEQQNKAEDMLAGGWRTWRRFERMVGLVFTPSPQP